jgi:hypothetical protein
MQWAVPLVRETMEHRSSKVPTRSSGTSNSRSGQVCPGKTEKTHHGGGASAISSPALLGAVLPTALPPTADALAVIAPCSHQWHGRYQLYARMGVNCYRKFGRTCTLPSVATRRWFQQHGTSLICKMTMRRLP